MDTLSYRRDSVTLCYVCRKPLKNTVCKKINNHLLCESCFEKINNKKVCVLGKTTLHGATLTAKDLRGGASLVLAGLAAKGITKVENLHHIDRGYENLQHQNVNNVRIWLATLTLYRPHSCLRRSDKVERMSYKKWLR
jgi:hypothetical protein